MSVDYFVLNNTSITTTPQPFLQNPFPDGKFDYVLNVSDQTVSESVITLNQGSAVTTLATGNVSFDQYGNSTIYLPPDYTTNQIYLNYVYTGPTNNGFYISGNTAMTGISINGTVTPINFTGALQQIDFYTSSGAVNRPVTWVGIATVTGLGAFTANISSAGFQNVFSVQATVLNATLPLYATLTSVSTSSVSGNVTGSLLGTSHVYIHVVGN